MPRLPDQAAPYPGDASYTPASAAPTSITSHPTRHGDRNGGDADEDARLTVLCRFPDLVAAGIVSSWKQLQNLIADENFPRGVMLSANVRAWPVNDIERWLAGRPTGPKAVNVAKQRETIQKRKQEAAEQRKRKQEAAEQQNTAAI